MKFIPWPTGPINQIFKYAELNFATKNIRKRTPLQFGKAKK